VVVGDPDLPAVAGRQPGDGNVAAKTDQHAAFRPVGD